MKTIHHLLCAASPEALLEQRKALEASCPETETVFVRYFLRDAAQRRALPDEDGAVSYIVQPPLHPGVAVAAWLIGVEGAQEVRRAPSLSVCRCGGTRFFWTAGAVSSGPDSGEQTARILDAYSAFLSSRGLSLEANCLRTWFFCDDIDHQYAGLVRARREFFTAAGLTPRTHYIASTGIAGRPVPEGGIVQMYALAVEGDFRQRYLYAPTHLNPTYEYGVTFERGVRLDACGSAWAIISGTASIDNKGQVLHVGDVTTQTRRMWENVEVLLREAGTDTSHIGQILVYLRRSEDYPVVAELFAGRFPDVPYVILHAPVCRPDWLIEMECMADIPLD